MYPRWGRSMGDITMADSQRWKERRDQVARYRVLEQETTDHAIGRALPLLQEAEYWLRTLL